MSREIRHRYQDPLDLIWLSFAQQIGIDIVRSSDVYASFDGQRTLTLSASEHFDADDSLAQLIFHEVCHALVAGEKKQRLPDWGMENTDERDLLQEHATHRLQAALASSQGLRDFFAVTTDHRAYWDALPLDPIAHGPDPAIVVAREGYARAVRGPWAAALQRALTQTRELCVLMQALPLPQDSLWRTARALHASGFPEGLDASLRCGGCAFMFAQGNGFRCRKTERVGRAHRKVKPELTACERFEAHFTDEECARCGACCREAFDRVEVRAKDPVRKAHPALVQVDGFGAHLPRPGGRCVALQGDGGPRTPYRCQIYAERPSSCADFAVRSEACLTARRRVGLSS